VDCVARITPVASLEELEREWRTLERGAQASFFQSWPWIGTWLKTVPAEVAPLVCRVFTADTLVGVAVFCARRRTNLHVLRARVALLSQTGAEAEDAITIEHNGIVCVPDREAECLTGALARMLERKGGWDEVIVSGLTADRAQRYRAAAQRIGATVRIAAVRPFFYVDLRTLRERHRDHLESLSSNTRYQIRRAMRAYEPRGALRCAAATSSTEALEFFEHLGKLHQKSWQDRAHPGAFANAYFVKFHRRLIQDAFAGGHIQILRITAGPHVIGYLYNLVHAGTVLSYQSGFEYEADAKIKPGLVCHSLAIAHNIAEGNTIYDLLAGDSQYKRSLATSDGEMQWLRICRPRLSLRLEDSLRQLATRPWIRRLAGRPAL
jgi:CelD/BcsL family acetyltransferase involved in cellulose biosynthesis